MKNALIPCKTCGKEIAKSAKQCPHCGAKNKKSLKQQLWWRLPLAGLVAIALFGRHFEDGPTCENESGKQEAIDAFNNGPVQKSTNLQIISLKEAKEISFDPKTNNRKCSAKILTNSSEEAILHYEFKYDKDGKGIISAYVE